MVPVGDIHLEVDASIDTIAGCSPSAGDKADAECHWDGDTDAEDRCGASRLKGLRMSGEDSGVRMLKLATALGRQTAKSLKCRRSE
jgi:hypothetical protein